MNKIIYKDLSANGPIEECRELCNALMQLQAERGVKYKEILASMSFYNRLKPSFEDAKERYLYVAYDGNKPIGYIFCDAFIITEEMKRFRFDWAKKLPSDAKGLYPDELTIPVKASHLNNIYVKPEYRNLHIGRELMKKGMEWLRSVPDAKYIFVHVSNGNNAGSLYEKYGFHYSHAVFDGMIDAYWLEI